MKRKRSGSIFGDIGLRQKYLISYSLILVFSLSIALVLTYQRTTFIVKNQVIHSSELIIKSIKDNMEKKLNTAEDASNAIYSNTVIRDILEKGNGYYAKTQQYEDMLFIQEFIRMFDGLEGVHKVKIYVQDGLIYSNENHSLFNIERLKDTEAYGRIVAANGRIIWLSPQTLGEPPVHVFGSRPPSVVSAGRLIKNFQKNNAVIGSVFVDVLKEDFDNLLVSSVVENHICYIIDEENHIVSSSYAGNEEEYERLSAFNQSLPVDFEKWSNVRYNGQNAFITYESINSAGWKIIYLIPIVYLSEAYISIGKYFLLIFGITCAVMIYMTYSISNKDVKRIEKVLRIMRNIQKKKFDERLDVGVKDEIGIIEENMNKMVDEICVLLEQQYEAGLKIKNAEYKLLQAQINPHFLYNTLELVNWMAINIDATEISDLVQKLSRYYRLSLSRGLDEISIKEEVSHAITYLEIQNQRFGNCVTVDIDIDDSILDCRIIKLVLQPIVENSFYHGILEKDDPKGTILISGTLINGVISIIVEDNGVGMSEEEIRNVFSSKVKRSGYGVRNTHNRLKLQYGEQYGLIYTSIPGRKTCVEIRVPEVRES